MNETLSSAVEPPNQEAQTASIRPRPELLAPAGDWDCARAAVENGADAIYFGLEKFNARMRAGNFKTGDLPKLMEFLHSRGVKGYATFNTLIFTNELTEVEEWLRTLITAGVDAAIVQDVGICRLIRRISPDFPIHASTQMTVTSAAGVKFAQELGCSLVVLARECSLKEIRQITPTAPVPIEVFVHGALCVAYSGQCLTSESLGGRSANRGECAQACRMPYELICDGQPVPLADRRYLLSPQDLAGLDVLPELVQSGVVSLKIEGRLKSPEYVASITQIYRQALDQAAPAPDSRYRMEMAFSRGLHTGWFGGIDNQRLVHARFGKKRGVFLGEVQKVDRQRIYVRLQAPLKPGDGIVFDAGRPDAAEQGGRVYGVETVPGGAAFSLGQDDVEWAAIHPGDKIWKTNDPELDRQVRRSFSAETPQHRRPLNLEVRGAAGTPMTVVAADESGRTVQLDSAILLTVAEKQPLTTERLREQLGRLGGTPYCLGQLTNSLTGTVILPMSELNRLRRQLAEEMNRLARLPKRWTINAPSPLTQPIAPAPEPGEAHLIVLVRNMEQLTSALNAGAGTIYCEFEDVKKYRAAVGMVRSASGKHEIFVAPPRIFKTGEEWILKQVQSSEADGYLARNYDHLSFFASARLIGDFSLNVANPWTAEYFKQKFNLERLTASYDLNITQLDALLQAAPPRWFEITLHQHMPMFHMEHCVFCAFLSKGTDFTNCGRPCDNHTVALRDRVGQVHPLKADAGCRNTVFNARAQTGAEYAARLLTLGVRDFRLEFANETPAEVAAVIGKYQALLRGEMTGAELWRELKLQPQLGVTRGPMAAASEKAIF